MIRSLMRFVVAALVLTPAMATAEPIKLKFSFFSSDRSNIYQYTIKPFVDAVNTEGKGLVEIEMFFSGVINKVEALTPQLVADGTADFSIIVPGQSPDRFGDTAVMELPGIYRNSHEASLIFTKLVAANALKGYDDYFVVGAFVSPSENVHSRKPIATNEDLKGLTIRTNNKSEAAVLQSLGAFPVLLPINQTTEAISRDKIDGAALPPSMLFEFGVGRVTANHFLIKLGGAPTALVMNRKKFESLAPTIQSIIRKYSGAWLAETSAKGMNALSASILEQLRADQRRTVTVLSPADQESEQRIAAAVVKEWAATNPHNLELLTLVQTELAKMRSSN